MRAAFRWIVLVVLVAVCAATGYAAYTLAGISWDAVVSYRSPYVAMKLPEAASGSETASRTVVVIVDGLRLDASRDMRTLEQLRQYGADVTLTAPQPSLSYPNWTTLLSGAPPYVSGVVTNWHEGAAQVETLFDTARRAGVPTVFVGPEDFGTLYGVEGKTVASFMKKWDDEYLSGQYVDAALRLAADKDPRLLVVHLPDVDEAGHGYGGGSAQYAEAVAKVDADLARLVSGLQDGHTVFVVTADHGHIDGGGHGGWESEVVQVPAVFSGPGIALGQSSGRSEDVAPTVAVIAGVGSPRWAKGGVLESVVATVPAKAQVAAAAQRAAFAAGYVGLVTTPVPEQAISIEQQVRAGMGPGAAMDAADAARLAYDRRLPERVAAGAGGVVLALLALGLILLASWRAYVAALAGTAAYYATYLGLFFLVHGYRWSLSAFNSEDLVSAWMNMRLIEAASALLVGAAVAAAVYPYLRDFPRRPAGPYLAGWLSLGPATAVFVLATLGIQVAWFLWAWGISPGWRLPDLLWGFKYDLDLLQATAVGFAAALTPLVTYLVGRYHPRVRRAEQAASRL